MRCDEPRFPLLNVISYRYEREVNLAQRPAIKRLQEQDSPASLPMVLCITSIISGEQQTGEGSSTSSSGLELTDGWYRIRANVDPPLQRAIDAGRLRTGYKMAIAGARVSWLKVHHEKGRESNVCIYSWTRRKKALTYSKP